ncbi:nickel pincer cofactor biosynthesis protein LarB [Streptomyces sp. TR1341]|uniref:nickel pincer cofactor biosynthesis protein LarB n=1 Tax=Streptomyces sp. TR1341 TaxID=2601266 RepID=UPI00138AEA15|nr:nickel pincer cofactor biosynthesis protein LarB [Streptomyces sp. TR1341]
MPSQTDNPPLGPGFADLGFARVDTAREARQGLPEAVYGPGKRVEDISAIVTRLLSDNSGPVMVTRIEPERARAVATDVPGSTYDARARLLSWRPAKPLAYDLTVVTAGTADGPVAHEAAAVARLVGLRTVLVQDVGVAGIHRLAHVTGHLRSADAVIVVAGMEGALASVVGGLVSCPVIAVPTSTGYGAGLEGVTALLAMLSSCAAGLTVVNIDSGYGAAIAAFRLAHSRRSRP